MMAISSAQLMLLCYRARKYLLLNRNSFCINVPIASSSVVVFVSGSLFLFANDI